MLDILDALLATAAVILGLSLVVQALQQIVKQVLDLKSKYMRVELLALFNETGEPRRALSNVIPLSCLSRLADGFSRRVVQDLEAQMSTFGLTDLHILETVDSAELKSFFLSLPVARDPSLEQKIADALGDIDRWFDISKKAFQEHYERRMKLWSVIISGLVVIGTNANLIDTYKDFSANKILRDAAIAMGEQLTALPRDSIVVRVIGVKADSAHAHDSTTLNPAHAIRTEIDSIVTFLDNRSFQVFGWTDVRSAEIRGRDFWQNAIHMSLGWVGMILLVSLGAPFWYDFFRTVAGFKDRLRSDVAAKPTQ